MTGSLANELTCFGCVPVPSVYRERPCAFLIPRLPFSIQQHPALGCERVRECGMRLCVVAVHTLHPSSVCPSEAGASVGSILYSLVGEVCVNHDASSLPAGT